MVLSIEKLYFNSIKVRLKLQSQYRTEVFAQFQFHKGTIKTTQPSFKNGY